MRQIELSNKEIKWLRSQLKERFVERTGEQLELNSYLKRYNGLCNEINSQLTLKDREYVSQSLLRKLFYDTNESSSAIFRTGFIDGCYRYITDGAFNRQEYLDDLAHIESQKRVRKLVRREVSRIFLYGLTFAFLLIISLIQLEYIDWRTLPWIFSTPPHHTLWVAEYPDGTKVFNRMRNYRTYEEVRSYFDSRYRLNKPMGDCNAYMLDDVLNHIAVCYDSFETIRKFESIHGTPSSIRAMDF